MPAASPIVSPTPYLGTLHLATITTTPTAGHANATYDARMPVNNADGSFTLETVTTELTDVPLIASADPIVKGDKVLMAQFGSEYLILGKLAKS